MHLHFVAVNAVALVVFFSEAVVVTVLLFSLQCVSSPEHEFLPTKHYDAQPLVENETRK